MSQESQEWLENNVLIGFKNQRAWWDRGALRKDGRPNHYPNGVPVADVRKLLFNWQAIEGTVTVTVKIDGKPVKINVPDWKAIVRPDTKDVFKIFSTSYRIHQFDEWLIKNVQVILDDDLQIGSAGLLKGGRMAWVQVENPMSREVIGFKHRPFILAATSMDGKIATSYRQAVTGVVCDNTLSDALGERSSEIKFRHTKNSLDGKVAASREALKIIFNAGDNFEKHVLKLSKQKVTDRKFDKWAELAAGLAKAQAKAKDASSRRGLTVAEKKRDTLIDLWENDDRVAPWRGNAFGVLQAWNTYVHHDQQVRGQTRPEANMTRVVTDKVWKEDRYALDLLARVR